MSNKIVLLINKKEIIIELSNFILPIDKDPQQIIKFLIEKKLIKIEDKRQKAKFINRLSHKWYRVIIKESHKDEAIIWLGNNNVIFECLDFNNDYFDTRINTIQFIFYEYDKLKVSRLKLFANLFGLNGEFRVYES